jgi:hypothetical protein
MTLAEPPQLLLARSHPPTLPRLDRDGALHRIRAGAYVRRSEWALLAPWERYRLRVLAVAATWSSPVFCLESAAILAGTPVFGEPRDVHLFDPDGRTWREGDVVVHGSADARVVTEVHGCAMTSLEDTAVDLCRVLPPAFGLAVADATTRRLKGGTTLRVGEIGRAQAARRGVRRLDWVQERTDAAAESPGESVSRAAIEWLGYEAPELQVTFSYEGCVDRTDFYWRRLRLLGESDGYGKYDADDAEATKQHFVREKQREDRLRRHEGGFARWDWADAVRWKGLDRKLAAAGLVPLRSRDLAMLATLETNPRSLPPAPRKRSDLR